MQTVVELAFMKVRRIERLVLAGEILPALRNIVELRVWLRRLADQTEGKETH